MLIVAVGIVLLAAGLVFVFSSGGPSRYPDGWCYVCRRGSCSSGDTCPKCGTEQP